MDAWIAPLLAALALPKYGLSTVFVVAFVSATLLPMGSEPAVFGLVKLNPELFWPAIVVATAGNTLGGALTWWMGRGAERVYEHVAKHPAAAHPRALRWLERFGPQACLLSWLPVVGDPLCAVAGWLQLPFWPCTLYMAISKFARYVMMTALLLWVFPGTFEPVARSSASATGCPLPQFQARAAPPGRTEQAGNDAGARPSLPQALAARGPPMRRVRDAADSRGRGVRISFAVRKPAPRGSRRTREEAT